MPQFARLRRKQPGKEMKAPRIKAKAMSETTPN
jgi:hypothetical protein